MSLSERLKEARKKAGKTQAEVAEAVKISQPAYQALESGRNQKSAFLPMIAKFLDVDTYWLTSGEEPKKLKTLSIEDIRKKFSNPTSELTDLNLGVGTNDDDDFAPEGFVAIDYYPEIRASAGNGYINLEDTSPHKMFIPTFDVLSFGASAPHCKIFNVDGESMIPELYPDQKVSVDMSAKKIYDGEIYAFTKGSELKIKILFNWGEEGQGGFRAVSRNPDKVRFPDEYYSPALIESENINIVGQYWMKIDMRKVRR